MRSLVLIGHGSHHHADSAKATQQAAEALRGGGPFSEVIAAYWQQEPSLRQILHTTASSDVTVIPMFLAEGYVTETVLPRELGLGFQGPVPDGGVARVLGGRNVRLTRPYGTHPAIRDVIVARAREVLSPEEEARATLVLVGQSVPGRPGTAQARSGTLLDHAAALQDAGLFAEVRPVFIDDAGALAHWQDSLPEGPVVVVPFFASESRLRHFQLTERLGLGGTPGRDIRVTEPVGTAPGLTEVLLQLAQSVSREDEGGDPDRLYAEAWSALLEQAGRGLRVGEVLVTPAHGVYELRHALDEGRAITELRTVVTPEGLRDLTAHDDVGAYRPVRTWRTLPRGWRAVLAPNDLPLGLRLLYPAVVEESYAHQHHSLHCTPWASTARRQTGSFAKVQRATPQQVDDVAARVCAPCLRTRLWAGQTLTQTFLDGVPGGMPCAEACMYLVAAVRDEMARRG